MKDNLYEIETLAFDRVLKIKYPFYGISGRSTQKLYSKDHLDILRNGFSVDEVVFFRSSKGMLRGVHFQEKKYAQDRLIFVLSGRLYIVVVDLQNNKKTYSKWYGEIIDSKNSYAIFVPKEFALGTLALDDAEFLLLNKGKYFNGCDRGFRYDDVNININWPMSSEEIIVTEKDLSLPTYKSITED